MRLVSQLLETSTRSTSRDNSRLVEDTLAEFTAKEQAIAAIKASKLPFPKQPVDQNGGVISPRVPLDLANTHTDKLATLMAQFTALADYAAYCVAQAEIDFSQAEHVYEYAQAYVRLEKTGTVQNKNDKTMIDPRVKAGAKRHFDALALRNMTQVLLRNYERDLNTISREISRRGQEQNRQRI